MKTKPSILRYARSIFFFVTLLISIVSISCNKEHDEARTWEGRVLEYGTEKPIPGARILLQDSEGEIFGPVSYFIIDSATTDNQGRFSFRTKNNVAGMRAVVTKDNYFRTFAYKSTGTNFNIIIDPHAWLRVKIVHKGPIGDNDTFGMPYLSCTPELFFIRNETTTIHCLRSGNREHKFKYYKTPTSQGTEIIDFTKYLPGHDTTEVVVKF